MAFAGITCAVAVFGLIVALALTSALRRDVRPDPRRGFEVVPAGQVGSEWSDSRG